ncbi:uncharacterized protein K460DRAFT_259121, partial [Cucurbitaria berberidis CBS 394.84]
TLRNQRESPLLRLPGEIRNRIYDYAFSGHIVHVLGPSREYPMYRATDWQPTGYSLSTLNNTTTLCRQIRSETVLLPLERNEFMLPPLLLSYLLSTLAPQQLHAITTVRLFSACW